MGEEIPAEKPTKKPAKKSGEWQFASIVSLIGKWAWVIIIVNAIIYVIWGLYSFFTAYAVWQTLRNYYISLGWTVPPFSGAFTPIWYLIGAIIAIIFALLIIKKKFSDKCGNKDWDALYDWVLVAGNIRIPWMLIWGIILEVFTVGWGGLAVLIPAVLLIFIGPKPYKWSTK